MHSIRLAIRYVVTRHIRKFNSVLWRLTIQFDCFSIVGKFYMLSTVYENTRSPSLYFTLRIW